jgi:5'-3' exonuclease
MNRLEQLCTIVGKQEQAILENREEETRKAASKKKRGGAPTVTLDEMDEYEEEMQQAFADALQEAMAAADVPASSRDAGNAAKEEKSSGDDGVEGGDEETAAAGWGNVTSKRKSTSADPSSTVKSSGNGAAAGSELVVSKDFRGRYYFEKFKIIASQAPGKLFLSKLMYDYLQGLMWCLAYYIKGCVSWTWYYPHHYGPMLQDMHDLAELQVQINFVLGKPFTPFQQLLGCLPPASSSLLPRQYQWLMVSSESPVLEFYPEDFQIDMDGKKNSWEVSAYPVVVV